MITFVIILVVALVAFGAYYFSPRARFRRRLEQLPLVAVAQAGPPAAKVRGGVDPGETIRAPLSGRPCVAYEVTIEEHRSGKSGGWRRRAKETHGIDFFLRDPSGVARVRVAGAPLETCFFVNHQSASGTFDDPTPAEAELLARHGLAGTHAFLPFNRQLRYREAAVLVGEELVVAGRAAREPDPGAAGAEYRDLATRLVLTGDAAFPLHISDDPRLVR